MAAFPEYQPLITASLNKTKKKNDIFLRILFQITFKFCALPRSTFHFNRFAVFSIMLLIRYNPIPLPFASPELRR